MVSDRWVPHNGPQDDFCSASEFEVLFGGAAGPGKTDCLVALATRHVDKPGYKGLLLRRTFPRLREIMDRCWKHYPTIGGEYRATEHRWTFPTGDVPRGRKATIELGHMQHEDDKYNYHGQEYQFAGFDELTQFTETQYLYLFSRTRSTNDQIPPRLRSTTNPGGIGHVWCKNRFVDIGTPRRPYTDPVTGLTRVFIPALLQDNPTLAENDPGYVARLEAMPEIERKRLLEGDWDVFGGQVFTELSQQMHACEPFDIPPEWERFMVLDWGFAKPFSVGWYAVDYDDNLYRYREWYGNKEGENDMGVRMIARDVAKGILEREEPDRLAGARIRTRYGDSSIRDNRPAFRRGESIARTIHEDLVNEGVFCLETDRDRLQGKMQVHARLRPREIVDTSTGEIIVEQPSVRIFSDHHHFWRTVPALQYDEKNAEDVDTKAEDHVYDEFRYACMARQMKPRKVEAIPHGSFARERSRMIRAKRLAARTGIPFDAAYRKTR